MYFPTTHWTLLARATLSGESAGRQALEDLCRRYWSPLFQFIRVRGHTEAEAKDLTQEFLLHLLEHSTLQRADRSRGRFRSFLCGALVRFLADAYDKNRAQKRGGQAVHTSLDDPKAQAEGVATPQETIHFDRAWAVAILRTSLARAQKEYAESGREAVFVKLRLFLPGAGEPPSYEQAAAQCNLSVAAFTSELHRLRKRVRELTRDEVVQTVSAPHEIEGELDHLRHVLMDRGTEFYPKSES
jgi:RNA polymerase sigma-70 factor (ECF subfamily)